MSTATVRTYTDLCTIYYQKIMLLRSIETPGTKVNNFAAKLLSLVEMMVTISCTRMIDRLFLQIQSTKYHLAKSDILKV